MLTETSHFVLLSYPANAANWRLGDITKRKDAEETLVKLSSALEKREDPVAPNLRTYRTIL